MSDASDAEIDVAYTLEADSELGVDDFIGLLERSTLCSQ